MLDGPKKPARSVIRIRPGTLIALLALTMSLGGVAYAAIGPNSVHSSNIAPKAVKTNDLGGNVVTAHKIAPGAVATPKLADAAITGAKLGLNTYYATQSLPDDGSVQFALAYCGSGQKVIAGGFSFDPVTAPDLNIVASFAGSNCPGSRGNCWIVGASNPPGGTPAASVTASAMCA